MLGVKRVKSMGFRHAAWVEATLGFLNWVAPCLIKSKDVVLVRSQTRWRGLGQLHKSVELLHITFGLRSKPSR